METRCTPTRREIFPGITGLLLFAATAFGDSPDLGRHFLRSKLAQGSGVIIAGVGVALDGAGAAYVTFSYRLNPGSNFFGSTNIICTESNRGLFISKYNSRSNCAWVRCVPNASHGGLAVQGTNIYVAAWLQGSTTLADRQFTARGKHDVLLMKLDAEGNFLWERQAGGRDYEVPYGVTVDHEGNCIITGEIRGVAQFDHVTLTNASHCDVFIAKYDPTGRLLWARRDGGEFTEPRGIAADAFGNLYITGIFSRRGHFSEVTLAEGSGGDMFLAKYNRDGQFLWAANPGGTGRLSGHNVAVDPEGNPHIVGLFSGLERKFGSLNVEKGFSAHDNVFLAKYTSTGELVFARQFKNGDFDFDTAIAIPPSALASETRQPSSVGTNAEPVTLPAHQTGKETAPGLSAVLFASTPGADSVAAPLPRLRWESDGAFLVLSWPAQFSNYVLETSSTITPFPIWTHVSTPARTFGQFRTVQIPLSEAQGFYRLVTP